MTTYQRETIDQVLDEIKPLLEMHWQEIAHYQDIPLDPDWDAYRRAEEAGKLRIYTARNPDLVGYGVFFVGNLHYRGTRIATQDILFLRPECRGTGVGFRLVRFCDAQLKAEGAEVVYHHVKLEHQALAQVLVKVGYRPIDIIYGRRL